MLSELQQDPRFAGQVSEGGMMSFAFAVYWVSEVVDTSRTSSYSSEAVVTALEPDELLMTKTCLLKFAKQN